MVQICINIDLIHTIWNKIRRISGKNTGTPIRLIINNGDTITNSTNIANAFADTYAKHCSNENYSEEFRRYKQNNELIPLLQHDNNDSPLNVAITITELEDTLNNLKNGSPGPDNIPAMFLVNLPQKGKDFLLNMYNLIWAQHKFPKIWSKATIVPVPKQDKNPNNTDSFRPISLTCV